MANKTVTVMPSGGTYTTLSGAIAGELVANANLVTMAGILTISIEGDWSGGADTTTVDVNGFTTSAAYYINIITNAANRAKASGWDATRYALSVTNDTAIQLRDDYIRIDGLQISTPAIDANTDSVVYVTGQVATNNYIRVSNCRLQGAGSGAVRQYVVYPTDTDMICDIFNCIVTNAAYTNSALIRPAGAAVNVYNCTCYGGYYGIYKGGGVLNIYDSAVLNNTDDFGGTPDVIDYCASDDGDGTNAVAEDGGGADWTGDFTDGSGGNWTLLSTSNLVGAGGRAGAGVFSVDIDGTTRGAAWDVGAHEYVPSGEDIYMFMST